MPVCPGLARPATRQEKRQQRQGGSAHATHSLGHDQTCHDAKRNICQASLESTGRLTSADPQLCVHILGWHCVRRVSARNTLSVLRCAATAPFQPDAVALTPLPAEAAASAEASSSENVHLLCMQCTLRWYCKLRDSRKHLSALQADCARVQHRSRGHQCRRQAQPWRCDDTDLQRAHFRAAVNLKSARQPPADAQPLQRQSDSQTLTSQPVQQGHAAYFFNNISQQHISLVTQLHYRVSASDESTSLRCRRLACALSDDQTSANKSTGTKSTSNVVTSSVPPEHEHGQRGLGRQRQDNRHRLAAAAAAGRCGHAPQRVAQQRHLCKVLHMNWTFKAYVSSCTFSALHWSIRVQQSIKAEHQSSQAIGVLAAHGKRAVARARHWSGRWVSRGAAARCPRAGQRSASLRPATGAPPTAAWSAARRTRARAGGRGGTARPRE